ncbi:cytochrome c-type biogenesis protein CcmH [Simiduia sp. 21SJ11W-1]|uniref:cytochrome c-type biogenesis protein n=1 Tax=Simiduia sp. 21SJ11W-1 TaxID=2909669 RepID=UPI0020A19B8A|nr:cytochrome c-type biogenesis protein [Simiduia sp. 21SJ11W-1]UTA49239.1 cytochrome c-type biogenesis protein CcmH [Simiduia sp. 21SJ11W-1]
MIRKAIQLLVVSVMLVCSAQAAIEVYEFEDPELRARYQLFTEEMRCPKCQNQNLAGSDSPIAADLRRELHRLLMEGKTDEQITDFMVARYGDFILYKPRVQSNTLMLWLTPLVLFALGVAIVLWFARGRARPVKTISDEERARLDALVASSVAGREAPSATSANNKQESGE